MYGTKSLGPARLGYLPHPSAAFTIARNRRPTLDPKTAPYRSCQWLATRNSTVAAVRTAKVNCNARMATRQLKQYCKLTQDSQELIRVAMNELNLSARAYDRILKVSRTIADLDGNTEISPEHVSEAIQYRTFDRTLWI